MLIEMRTNYAGPSGIARRGKVIELPDAEAREIIEEGYGVAVKRSEVAQVDELQVPETETASADISETTRAEGSAPRRRGRPRKNPEDDPQ